MKLVDFLLIGLVSATTALSQTGEADYLQYCAGCHGKNLEGANSKPLKKTAWLAPMI